MKEIETEIISFVIIIIVLNEASHRKETESSSNDYFFNEPFSRNETKSCGTVLS